MVHGNVGTLPHSGLAFLGITAREVGEIENSSGHACAVRSFVSFTECGQLSCSLETCRDLP